MSACRSGIAGNSVEPSLPAGAARQNGAPRLRSRRKQDGDLEPPAWQERTQPLGPFDQRNAVAERLLDTELPGLLRMIQAIKVEVPDRRAIGGVHLHESEGWARHLV